MNRRTSIGLIAAAVVALTSLALAAMAWNRIGEDASRLGTGRILLFYLATVAVHTATFVLWRRFSRLHGASRARADALVDLGMTAIGKYVPGKIVGLLGRGAYTDGRLRPGARQIAISFSEQLLCLWGGVALLCAFWLTTVPKLVTTQAIRLPIGVVALATLVVLPFACAARMPRLRANRFLGPTASLPVAHGVSMVLGYTGLWVLNALPFAVLATLVQPLGAWEHVEIAAAFLAAVIAGWLAVLVPAGLGVREAAFVALAPDALGWEQAAWLIALHRGLSTVFDVAIGTIALRVAIRRQRERPDS